MYQYKITVIIPVYNSQKTLKKTVDSILSQIQDDIEIILVDDGSIDESPKLCDMYSEENSNIVVIHKSNGGLSSARNAGINKATGQYLTFIDSDDYYSCGLFGQALSIIQDESPDLIYYGWQYVYQNEVQPGRIADIPKRIILDKQYIHEEIIPPMINLKNVPEKFIDDFSVNKFYKNDILKEYAIRFNEKRRIWEDRPFVVEYLSHCNSFYCMDGCWYNYVQTAGSLSGKYYLSFFDIILENYHLYEGLFGKEYNFEIPYVYSYWKNAIQNMIFRSLNETKNREEIEENIVRTLKNPFVQKWYLLSNIDSFFERIIIFLLEKGKYNQILLAYKAYGKGLKIVRKSRIVNFSRRIMGKLKRFVYK